MADQSQTRKEIPLTNVLAKAKLRGSLRIGPAITHVLEGIFITAERLEPRLVVENRPTRVYFSVANYTNSPTSGWVQVVVKPMKALDLPQGLPTDNFEGTYTGNFRFQITDLKPNAGMSGVISFIAPKSQPPRDGKNRVTVQYVVATPGSTPTPGHETKETFPGEEIIAQDSLEFDVAARYSVTLAQVHISAISARFNDTLFVAQTATAKSLPTSKESKSYGEHIAGAKVPLDFAGIGPFDSLPDARTRATLTWVIANAGHTDTLDIMNKVLNIISDIGAAIATLVWGAVYAPLSAAVDALHHLINDAIFKDCDTIIGIGTESWSGDYLHNLTLDPADRTALSVLHALEPWTIGKELVHGPPVRHEKKAGEIIMSPLGDGILDLGPGCNDADYFAYWTIRRHRRPVEWMSLVGFVEDGMRVPYGTIVTITYPSPPKETVVWNWTREGNGQIDGLGNYQAPPSPQADDDAPFAVVIGEGLVNGQAKYFGFTIIQLG